MLNEKVLGKRLHLSTAAHKPTHYNFGSQTTPQQHRATANGGVGVCWPVAHCVFFVCIWL